MADLSPQVPEHTDKLSFAAFLSALCLSSSQWDGNKKQCNASSNLGPSKLSKHGLPSSFPLPAGWNGKHPQGNLRVICITRQRFKIEGNWIPESLCGGELAIQKNQDRKSVV